jgi:hypothetical protein
MLINGIYYYVIYHAVGVKCGCTVTYRYRKSRYKEGTVFEILDLIPRSLGDKFAGDIEWFYADWYGYQRGPHYSKSNWGLRMTQEQRIRAGSKGSGSKGGTRAAELGKTGFMTMSQERRGALAKKGSEVACAGPNHNSKQILTCTICGRTMKGLLAMASHMRAHTKKRSCLK